MSVLLIVLVVLLIVSNALAWRMLFVHHNRLEDIEDFCNRVVETYGKERKN